MGLPFGNVPGFPDPPDIGILSILEWILSILQWVVNVLIAVLEYVIALINALVQILIKIFTAIGKFLLHVWTNYIKKGISWLASHIQKIRDWLKRTLKPVIDFFQKVKKWYDTHILAQQLRLLRMLQTIRRFLGILRLFHVKFATTLDNAIADIENRIEKAISITRGILNQIINTLAIVLDPVLLVTRDVLGGSLLKNLGALRRVFGFYHHGPFTAAEQTYYDHNVGRYQASTAGDHIATLASTGLTDYDQSEVTAARAAITGITGIPTGL
jgi:hypothetical protein